MCFIRVSPKHAPIKPPGAAPTLTSVYDRPFLDTSVDIENPTSHEIVRSLNVDEKLHPVRTDSADEIELQPIRRLSAEEALEKTERRGGMPKGRRAIRKSIEDNNKDGGKKETTSKY